MEIIGPDALAPGCCVSCMDICFLVCLYGMPFAQFTNDSVAWVQLAFGTSY